MLRNDGNITSVPDNTIALCTDKVSELRRDCMIWIISQKKELPTRSHTSDHHGSFNRL